MRFKLLFLALTVALNVSLPTFGEEVRLIYFEPKGVGPLNPDFMAKQVQELLKDVCNLFENQVGKPFKFEKEDGSDDAKVHFVKVNEHYTHYRQGKKIDDKKILDEIRNSDLGAEMSDYLYLIAAHIGPLHNPNPPVPLTCGLADYLLEPAQWRFWEDPTGPWAIVDISANCSEYAREWFTAHELGHAFGLGHDFRNSDHIMSYGGATIDPNGNQATVIPQKLSKSAIQWLNASRFFNDVLIIDPDQETEIEFASKPVYLRNTDELHLQFVIKNTDDLHQAHLYVSPKNPPPGYRTGYKPKPGEPTLDDLWRDIDNKLTLHDWKQLKGSTETIPFIYSKLTTQNPLDDPNIHLRVIDSHGNITNKVFTLDSDKIVVKNALETADGTSHTDDFATPSDINDATQNTRLRATLRGHTDFVTSIAFSPNGQKLVSSSWDNSIKLWDSQTTENLATGLHAHDVTSVVFSPDGRRIASGGVDEVIRLWNSEGKQLASTYTTQYLGTFTSVVFIHHPDARYYRVAGANDLDGGIDYFNYYDGNNRLASKYYAIGEHATSSLAISPDQSMLASGGSKWDMNVTLWDPYNNKILKVFEGHTDFVTSVAFSPDRRTLASGSWDNTVRLWNIADGESTAILKGHTDQVLAVAFSPDGRTLASGSNDQTIRLWDATTGQQKDTLLGHTSGVTAVAFSPDRKILASAGGWDNTVRLWDLSPSAIPAPIVRISPSPVVSPPIGDKFDVKIDVSGVQNVAGYQAKVRFDPTALRYIDSANGTYLSDDTFTVPPVVSRNQVTLAATSLSEDSDGAGTLVTLTFEVVAVKPSYISLSDVVIMERDLTSIPITLKGSNVVVQSGKKLDVNGDSVVDLQDMTIVAEHFGEVGENQADVNGDGNVDLKDLLLVAGQLNAGVAAPSVHPFAVSTLTAEDIQIWLNQAQQLDLSGTAYQKGIALLQQLLIALAPKETGLLPNYPNPFNPETWIPYQLAKPADVAVHIHSVKGNLIRTLALGHQPIGIYQRKSRAAYWDGKNELGEPVASGVYFYTLIAGEFMATRKMLILK